MIAPDNFLAAIYATGINVVTGVPDSLLKEVSAHFLEKLPASRHIIAANEGAAIGLAIGNYLATGQPALVYMQNSGLGNSINPLVSLADPQIYGCPLVMLIGWRGELLADNSQVSDEPQHIKQGQITLKLLDTLGIPFQIMSSESDPKVCLEAAVIHAMERKGPVAIVVRKGSFSYSKYEDNRQEAQLISREEAIKKIVEILPDDVPVIATTGMLSRELFELRKVMGTGHHRDFLSVGGMGHAVSIAAGMALGQPSRRVVCLDGDGAMLMQMGALTNSATCSNLIHIVLNNGAHDSVGGQPTRAAELTLSSIARTCGYHLTANAGSPEEISQRMSLILANPNSSFLEISCRRGSRANLGRPTRTPAQNIEEFMRFVRNEL